MPALAVHRAQRRRLEAAVDHEVAGDAGARLCSRFFEATKEDAKGATALTSPEAVQPPPWEVQEVQSASSAGEAPPPAAASTQTPDGCEQERISFGQLGRSTAFWMPERLCGVQMALTLDMSWPMPISIEPQSVQNGTNSTAQA